MFVEGSDFTDTKALRDQLIATCMNEKVKWMQEKSELRDMWMQEKLELRDILMKEKATMATEKDACLREIIQVKEAVLQAGIRNPHVS